MKYRYPVVYTEEVNCVKCETHFAHLYIARTGKTYCEKCIIELEVEDPSFALGVEGSRPVSPITGFRNYPMGGSGCYAPGPTGILFSGIITINNTTVGT